MKASTGWQLIDSRICPESVARKKMDIRLARSMAHTFRKVQGRDYLLRILIKHAEVRGQKSMY
jgi:hypothetical protein